MDRSAIDKIAQTAEDKLLLAKLWDKIQQGIRKNILAYTCFLSPRELQIAEYLFGACDGLHRFGGYSDAERQMLIYLPDYLESECLFYEDSPVICLRASFYQEDHLTHRDFLGALIGIGITRESVGDILVSNGTCDFFVTPQVAPFLLQNFESAGRTKVKLERIPLLQVSPPEPKLTEIRDTVASVRLDSIVSSGFRISRAHACDAIAAGRVAIDGVPCQKPDRILTEGCKIACRGSGKIRLTQIGHKTKKDRISVIIHRYE